VGVVRLEDGNCSLQNDGSVIEVLVDEMNGAARDFYAVVECLLLGVEAGKGGKERGVDVEDAVGKRGDESRREQTHVTGQADEVYSVVSKAGDEVLIVIGAGAALGDVEGGGKAEVFGGREAEGIGDVGNDDGDFDVGEFAFADVAGDGEEVGAAAGEEDA